MYSAFEAEQPRTQTLVWTKWQSLYVRKWYSRETIMLWSDSIQIIDEHSFCSFVRYCSGCIIKGGVHSVNGHGVYVVFFLRSKRKNSKSLFDRGASLIEKIKVFRFFFAHFTANNGDMELCWKTSMQYSL